MLTEPRWVGSQAFTSDFNITYRLVTDDVIVCGEAVEPENSCEADLTFKPVKQPRVRIVGIKTPGDEPTRAHLIEQAKRIESLMPIPQLDYELRTLDAMIDPPPDSNDAMNEILTELEKERAKDNSTLVYLGVLASATTSGLANRLSKVAVWDIGKSFHESALADDRHYGSHELGHVIGVPHSAYELEVKYDLQTTGTEMQTICSDPTDETARIRRNVEVYPYLLEVTTNKNAKESWAALGPVDSSATEDTEMWGLDTRFVKIGPDNLAVINPREVFSIMSYCQPNDKLVGVSSQGIWDDAYHHPKFIDKINQTNWNKVIASGATGSSSNSQTVFRGYFTMSVGGIGESSVSSATVLSVMTLEPEARLYTPSGDYILELLDIEGNVLRSVSFGAYEESEIWMVPVADPPDWASYRVSKPPGSGAGGAEGSSSSRTVLVEVSRSANAPVVSVTAPTAGQVISGDEVTFSWSGSDADGDDLSYTVEYSSDGGASYETIAISQKSTTLTVDRSRLAGSATAKVKVTAADGTRTASAESAVFTVSQNRPEVFIHSPAADLISGSGALVLDATAYDTEDGLLDSSAVQWSSDSGGNLGTGGFVVVYPEELEPGPHRLTATATDSTGATGAAEVFWFNPIPLVWSPPGAPAGVIATGGIRSITVSWTALAASLASDYYQYRYRPVSGAWTEWAGLPGVREHTITGLSSNTAYEVELRTVTTTDISDPVRVTATTAATPPAAPAGLTAAGGDGRISLSWDHPADRSITAYQFREKPTFDDDWWCWTSIWNGDAETTSYRVPDLSGGTDYRIQIRARNALGAGPATEVSATTAPAAPPGTAPAAPAGLTAVAGDRSISLSWDNPRDPTIIEYQFRERSDHSADWHCWRHIYNSTANTVATTIPGITNDIRYRVQIRAVNPTGAGPTSETTATPTAGP